MQLGAAFGKVFKPRSEEHLFNSRKAKTSENFKKHGYPHLNINELHAIRVIAGSLYENIKAESEKSLELYKQLDKAFVQ